MPAILAHPEDIGHLVDGKMPLEDEVPAVFDLVHGVLALQMDGLAVLL